MERPMTILIRLRLVSTARALWRKDQAAILPRYRRRSRSRGPRRCQAPVMSHPEEPEDSHREPVATSTSSLPLRSLEEATARDGLELGRGARNRPRRALQHQPQDSEHHDARAPSSSMGSISARSDYPLIRR